MIANPKGCVGLEDIAALAEGRLSGAERERVVGHVAGCEECREVLAGVMGEMGSSSRDAAGRDSSQTAAAPRGLSPTFMPRGAGRWIPRTVVGVAAALMLIVSVVVYQRVAATRAPSQEAWLAEMPPPAQMVDDLWGG